MRIIQINFFKETKMRIIQCILCVAIVGFGFTSSYAAKGCDDMGSNSVNNMELNDDGSIKKLTAIGQGEVDFPDDPSEIEDARQVAEMEAKAAIAHFMKEEIKSEKSIEKISKKMKEQTSAGKKVSKKTMQTQIRKIHNNAQSLLKGVVSLEECFDSKKNVFRVMVGVSMATMKAADSLRQKSHEDALANSGGSGGSGSTGGGSEMTAPGAKQDSFRRKSKIQF
tara:strand:+ start:91 stop:762 length:672 start_codon:yes stop_codon:yes gene_type:complete